MKIELTCIPMTFYVIGLCAVFNFFRDRPDRSISNISADSVFFCCFWLNQEPYVTGKHILSCVPSTNAFYYLINLRNYGVDRISWYILLDQYDNCSKSYYKQDLRGLGWRYVRPELAAVTQVSFCIYECS